MHGFIEYNLTVEGMDEFEKPLNITFGVYGDPIGIGIWSLV